MADLPPLVIVEPSSERGVEHAARLFVRKEKRPDPAAVKKQLTEIRERARADHEDLRGTLERTLAALAGVTVSHARDADEAVSQIAGVAGPTRLASVNKSNVILNELRQGLDRAGFRTYLRYCSEFKNFEEGSFEKKLLDYWSLPGLHDRNLTESFDVRKRAVSLAGSERRDYIAILGVNAISAEDGSLYFLQHMSNISRDLEQARAIVAVVPLEKIVRDSREALLHTRAMGVFGLESVLLDLEPHPLERYDFEALEPLAAERRPAVHLILYDNGRTSMLSNAFRDLFLCIDCRACARQCPVGQHLLFEHGLVYSPKNYLLAFLQGLVPSVEGCLHCGRCHVECPVGIDLPALLWRSQVEHYARHRRSWKKRLLDDPELLAKIGSQTAPLSTWMTRMRAVKVCIQLVAGVHRKANLPPFQRATFRTWLKGGRRG